MKGGFLKYMTDEDHLQHQVTEFMKWQHPRIRWHHSPNEGKRSLFEQFKYKYLGSDSGFPDLLFPGLMLVIELKIKPNKPTKNQLDWLEYFKSCGWRSEVCYDFESVVKIINEEVKRSNKVTAAEGCDARMLITSTKAD
jgi:hypothetical protein